MEIILFLGLMLIVYGILLLMRGRKKKQYDPFGFNTVMIVREKCLSCSFINYRTFKRGDYIFKKTSLCPKCNGQLEIDMICMEYEVSPKQRKWEEYCKKWR